MTFTPRTAKTRPDPGSALYFDKLRRITLNRFAQIILAKGMMRRGFSMNKTAQILGITSSALSGEKGMLARYSREGIAGLVPKIIPPKVSFTPHVIELGADLDSLAWSDVVQVSQKARRGARRSARGL